MLDEAAVPWYETSAPWVFMISVSDYEKLADALRMRLIRGSTAKASRSMAMTRSIFSFSVRAASLGIVHRHRPVGN